MRKIDADAIVYESIDSSDTCRHESYYGTGIIAVRKEDIDAMPTIEEPRPKPGQWIKMSDADGEYFCCSKCGESLHREWVFNREFDVVPRRKSIDKSKYCPNCGSPMEVEVENELGNC